MFHNKTPAQYFGAFRVGDLKGQTLFEDLFRDSSTASRWKIVKPSSAHPHSYPMYRREDMLAPQAPLIRKTRYVSDRHIRG